MQFMQPVSTNRVKAVGEGNKALLTVADPESLVEKLRLALHSPGYRPPVLPAIGIQLLELSRQKNVNFSTIHALLERDPLLTAAVLRRAQSAIYAGAGRLNSLESALVRLGLRTLTDMFLAEAMHARFFRAKGYDEVMGALRRHSTAVAYLSREVARRAGLPDEYSFLCGLLHDAGIAAALLILADGERGRKPPPLDTVLPSVLAVHEEAGRVLASAWHLPADVSLVLGHHHGCMVDGQPHPVAASVSLADWLAGEVGFYFMEPVHADQALRAAEILKLSNSDLGALLTHSRALLAQVGKTF